MLLLLSGVDRSVSQLAKAVRLSQSCTTRHLQSLERAGLVKGVRDGKRVVFRPAPRDATASGVLASLLRNADELAGTFDDETPSLPRSREARATRTIAVDGPLPAGEVVVAGRSPSIAKPRATATANVMLAAGRSRRSGAARREASRASARRSAQRDQRKPEVRVLDREATVTPPRPAASPLRPAPEEQAPAHTITPEAAPRTKPEKPAPRIEPENLTPRTEPETHQPHARVFDEAFEPEFEQPFQPHPPRVEPESGKTSDPHEPPESPQPGARRSSDIEDFLL